MKKFPIFAGHAIASCFNCGGVLDGGVRESGSPSGHGQFTQACAKCGMFTSYDVVEPGAVLQNVVNALETVTPRAITIRYSAVDGYRKRPRRFKTIAGARKFAQERIGRTPEMGGSYAVSSDGIGKITVEGATLAEIFPNTVP